MHSPAPKLVPYGIGCARRAALDATGGRVEERRAHCGLHGGHAGVAAGLLVAVVAVREEAGIPVPLLLADVEDAFQARAETVGVQLAAGAARHFPQAAEEVGIAGGRVRIEVAVGGQQAEAVVERITGDLLLGHALVVADIGDERDVVVDIEGAADEQRATLEARLQVHISLALARSAGVRS